MKVKVSDFISNFFLEKGINQCYTVTGGGAMHLNDSFGMNPNYQCVYNHHEQACAMAAEGYARISGKPAIVCVTSGPGTTNALTGVLGSWLDSVPMIIISGQMKRETLISSTTLNIRQLGFQEYNIIDSVKSMTKYCILVNDTKYLRYHLEKAYIEATTGRKGPVWLDIPIDIQGQIIDLTNTLVYPFEFSTERLNKDHIDFILQKINCASKPVLLAGYQVRMDNAHYEFIDLINFLGIPVLTEWNCHDLLEDTHPLNAGRPGTIGDRCGNFVLQNADLLICLGCQLSIRQISYEWKNFAKKAFIIGINSDSEELIKPTIKVDYGIKSSTKLFSKEILKSSLVINKEKFNGWKIWISSLKNKYQILFDHPINDFSKYSIYHFFDAFSNNLPSNSITVLANGAACVAGLQSIKISSMQRLFTNAGASSMGYAICAAIGANNAIKNSQCVYCIEGDGSIQMNLQELQTIIHNNLNIKLFWINNDGYHSIKQTQKSMFDAEKRGYCGADSKSGISFPSAKKIAHAYNLPYFKIDNYDEANSILRKINLVNGPILCEVVTDPNEDFKPKLVSKMNEDGSFYTPNLDNMYPFLPEDEMISILEELNNLVQTYNEI